MNGTKDLDKFIKKVKRKVRRQKFPAIYNPKSWNGKYYNCYLYALRARTNVKNMEWYVVPGFISNGRVNYLMTTENLVKHFMEDLSELGLKAVKTSARSRPRPNSYKIAIYVNEVKKDFHFARQDSNGQWSEKMGWKNGIHLLDVNDVSKNIGEYKFVGVFRVSKKE